MEILKKVADILLFPLKIIAILIIYFYKIVISPLFPPSCIYTPSCSTYMLLAIKRFGLIRGFFIGIKRIAKCHAGQKGGIDPLPENLKGESKWII